MPIFGYPHKRCSAVWCLLAFALLSRAVIASDDLQGAKESPFVAGLGVDTPFRSVVTQITDNSSEFWACAIDDLIVAMYMFLPAGTITGLNPEHQLGMEIDPALEGMAYQRRFLWSMPDAHTVIMKTPGRDDELIWRDIEFTHAERMTLNSSTRGLMRCQRGTGHQTKTR